MLMDLRGLSVNYEMFWYLSVTAPLRPSGVRARKQHKRERDSASYLDVCDLPCLHQALMISWPACASDTGYLHISPQTPAAVQWSRWCAGCGCDLPAESDCNEATGHWHSHSPDLGTRRRRQRSPPADLAADLSAHTPRWPRVGGRGRAPGGWRSGWLPPPSHCHRSPPSLWRPRTGRAGQHSQTDTPSLPGKKAEVKLVCSPNIRQKLLIICPSYIVNSTKTKIKYKFTK